MNRAIGGLVVLAIGVGSWACKGDPQGDLRPDAVQVIAAPSSLFIDQGETELVLIEVLDAQGNQLGITDFALTSDNPGVTVVEDSAFNLIFDAGGTAVRPSPWTRARFIVGGVNTVGAMLTASGGGVTLDIPVRVVPVSLLTGALSATTPALTETVTITMPAGVVLDPATSTVTFSDGSVPANVVVDPSGTSVSFLAAPNTNAPATVTNATMTYAPTVPPFSIPTVETLTAVAVTQVPVTYSSATPPGGAIVRMTAGAGFLFTPASVVSLLGGEVIQVAIAADSSYIDFVPSVSYAQNLPPNITAVNLVGTPFAPDLPADIFFTSGAGLAGTDQFATAPTPVVLPAPGSGASVTFYDSGPFLGSDPILGGPDRIYKFVVAATSTITFFHLVGNGTTDIDVVYEDIGGGLFGTTACATGAIPEICTGTFAAGTYFMVFNLYAGATPGIIQTTLTIQ